MTSNTLLSDLSPDEVAEYVRTRKRLRKSPKLFATHILGINTLEAYQINKILNPIAEFDRVAIRACHAVGKTFTLGGIVVPWFTTCHDNSIVITTAPTNRQVETLLWGEIRKAYKRSKTDLGGKMTLKKWVIDDDWYAMGFSPHSGSASDTGEQQGSSFQGFHAKYVLIVFDEATGVPQDIYTMAEGLLTSGAIVKWVCIANPTSTASPFFQICRQAEWHVETITCFDSPNMIANGFIDRATVQAELDVLRTLSDYERLKRIKNYLKPNDHLLSAQWAIAKIYQWGWDHPLTKSKILGEFPDKNDDVVVKWDSMQAAINREPELEHYDKRYIGVDVARFGDDSTVITEFRGVTFASKTVHLKEDTQATAGYVIQSFLCGNINKETHITIDCTGVGAGVYDALKEAKREGVLPSNVYIHEVNFGSAIYHEDAEQNEELNKRYENVKAYIFDLLNQDLRDRLSMPQEEIYQTETVNILYKFSKRGKLCIESKDDFKKRIKKSPDESDSLALANFARYLKPSYGVFKGKDQATIGNGHNSAFAKKSFISRIKVNKY